MSRRTVLIRCGWCVGAALSVMTVLLITGGPKPSAPSSAPSSDTGETPRLPAYASNLFTPTPEFDAESIKRLTGQSASSNDRAANPRTYPSPGTAAKPAVYETTPAQVPQVVPAGGAAAGSPTPPVSPIAPLALPTPTVASIPVAPVAPGWPQAPAVPISASSPVPGAPTAPTVPVPTMATLPGEAMPISPASFPPAAAVAIPPPAKIAMPSAPLAPAAPLPAVPTAPVAPAALAEIPPRVAPHGPIHPSQPAMFPQQPMSLPPMALPTPAELKTPQPVEPTPDLRSLVTPSFPLASPGPGADGTPLNDYWRHGLRFESDDQAFSIFIGGRFQFDTVGYLATTAMRNNIPGNVPLEDGVSFRRFRFDMGGTLYKNMEYYAQIDFFNGFVTDIRENRLANVAAPTDLWLTFKDVPLIGNIRVGNQKPLYSFEHLTSSRFLQFLERSLGFDAFVENFNNGFEPGITLLNTYADHRGTWGVGLFKNTRSVFAWNVGRNEAEVNGRVTYLPVYSDNGMYLVHVGVGGAYRDLDQDQMRNRSRLDARNSPSAFSPLIADTGLYFGHNQQLLIPELAVVAGPWTFQSEYYASWVQGAATAGPNGQPLAQQGTVYMQSAYGEVLLFLTGEHREYNREGGVFTRVVPKRPLAWSRCGFSGCGAWQLAARYSYLDLNDKGINGGRIHDMTLGLNWFLNPNMKVQWNYFLAHRNVADPAGDGFIQGFATRLAIDF